MKERGKLVVIDGLDGTGKATQTAMLSDYLFNIRKDYSIIDFPRYGNESCHMVESYLHGKFGCDPGDVDPYTASMFYAIDRSISFKTEEWGETYRNGGIVVADRYTCSNIIHQAQKVRNITLSNPEAVARNPEFVNFVKWIYDTEYSNIGLPKPDVIIYLTMSEEANQKLLEKRMKEDITHNSDIHEANKEYLNKCRKTVEAYKTLTSDSMTKLHFGLSDVMKGITHVFIVSDDPETHEIRSKEDIHLDIISALKVYNII